MLQNSPAAPFSRKAQQESHFTFRIANNSDADALTQLINAAFEVERPFIGSDRIDREGTLKYLSAGQFLLLEDSGSLVGCVYLETKSDRMYLGLLSIDPAQQGKGLGRKLMTAAEELAVDEGCIAMDLRTISPRTDIQPFYAHLGYVVTGTSPIPADIPMAVPAHFVHMSKSLQKALGAR
jgi:N-acetylglutamate synthase-like GNAT family acetyltransferase